MLDIKTVFTRIGSLFGVFAVLTLWMSSAQGAPKVEVVTAGSGPKTPLAFDIAAGTRQTMGMSWSIQLNMDMAGFKVDMSDLPTVDMRFSAHSPEGVAGDVISYTTTLDEVSFASNPTSGSNPMVEEMKAELRALSGMTSMVKVKPTGSMISNAIQSKAPKAGSMGQQLLDALDESAILFPTEPVGVGAVWTVTEDVDQQGIQVRRVTTLKLKERKGSVATIGLSMRGEVLDKSMDAPPGMPAGAKATIDTFVMSGEGNMVYDLTRLFPMSSDVSVNVNTAMTIESDGTTASASSGLRFTVNIKGE